jgi:site-specific DNA recombinase
MKRLFGYIRVSTTKQAEKGVSLDEQRNAITAYAEKHGFTIVEWFEEWQTAAKRGRPKFTAMLKALRKGKADGVVIHKIDRSARNLRDWSDLGELIDGGIDVHFAHDPVDLRSRGGRLSADILAVVAADFIRNNKDEARKGFYGRLKQGIYPLGAPIGYVDNGKGGKVKTIDPVRGPLVRFAFHRYATGEVSLALLADELTARGLRTKGGKPLPLNRLAAMLRNPFYAGIIRLKKTGETFEAVHVPLVRKATFERVQEVLDGKKPRRTQVHDYFYRRLVACGTCRRALVGSVAKGRIYYRCQIATCPTTSLREDALDESVASLLQAITLPETAIRECVAEIQRAFAEDAQTAAATHARLTGELGAVTARLERLTDVYLEGRLEKDAYEERRGTLVFQRDKIKEALLNVEPDQAVSEQFLIRCVELARRPDLVFRSATKTERRRLLEIMTSNRIASGKNLTITPAEPFCFFTSARIEPRCALGGGKPPTSNLAKRLLEWLATRENEVNRLTHMMVAPVEDEDTLAA